VPLAVYVLPSTLNLKLSQADAAVVLLVEAVIVSAKISVLHPPVLLYDPLCV
jgi:hypothetical protein